MAQDLKTDSSGQHFAEYGMAGSPARKDYEDLRYMEKAGRKRLDKDAESDRKIAKKISSDYENVGRKKTDSKKTTKKVVTTKK